MNETIDIGKNAESYHKNCVVIGRGMKSTEDYQVVIGNEKIQLSFSGLTGEIRVNDRVISNDAELVEAIRKFYLGDKYEH